MEMEATEEAEAAIEKASEDQKGHTEVQVFWILSKKGWRKTI